MFGLSLGEIMLLLIVGIVVVGPKNLPSLMRTAGQWISKIRRMSSDLRNQSGIDDLIRQEGLEREIHELRSLSRMNVVESLMSPALTVAASPLSSPSKGPDFRRVEPLREREYPLVGCDAGGALADDAVIYPGPTPYPPPQAEANEASAAPAVAPPRPADEDRQESPSV